MVERRNAMPIQAAKEDARNKLVEAGIIDNNGQLKLLPSQNKYDWLGNGIYFWESDPIRAYE